MAEKEPTRWEPSRRSGEPAQEPRQIGGRNPGGVSGRPGLLSVYGRKPLGTYGAEGIPDSEGNVIFRFNERMMRTSERVRQEGYPYRELPVVLQIPKDVFDAMINSLINAAFQLHSEPVKKPRTHEEPDPQFPETMIEVPDLDEKGEPIMDDTDEIGINWQPRDPTKNLNYETLEDLCIQLPIPQNVARQPGVRPPTRYLVLAGFFEPRQVESSPSWSNTQWLMRLAVKERLANPKGKVLKVEGGVDAQGNPIVFDVIQDVQQAAGQAVVKGIKIGRLGSKVEPKPATGADETPITPDEI
jgi:hypothetical protein